MPEATPDVTPPVLPPSTTVTAIQSVPWYKSKTILVNIGMLVVSVLSGPEIAKLIGPGPGMVAITTIITVVNGLLRVVTFAPLTGSIGATAAMAAQPAALAASVEASSPTLVARP